MRAREKIEWLNYWIEEADNEERKRILLLGDSVARGYRKVLNRMVQEENYVVDLLATSYCILDSSLIEEIKHFKSTIGYTYQYVIFQMGYHHGYWIKCRENKSDYEKYYCQLEAIFNILREISDNIITVSSTPEKTDYADCNNDELEVRSNILQNVSMKYKYKYVNLYDTLYENTNFPMIDIVHYSDKGYEYIAHELSKALGFCVSKIEANRIDDLKTLRAILEKKKIYIYGDGKRGELLHKYLCTLDLSIIERHIVSDEFYHQDNKYQIQLSNVVSELGLDDIILVTPEDISVWNKLKQLKCNYYTIGNRIYTFIEEYVSVYTK